MLQIDQDPHGLVHRVGELNIGHSFLTSDLPSRCSSHNPGAFPTIILWKGTCRRLRGAANSTRGLTASGTEVTAPARRVARTRWRTLRWDFCIVPRAIRALVLRAEHITTRFASRLPEFTSLSQWLPADETLR